MTRDDDENDQRSRNSERLLEALRDELAKQKLLDDPLTPEELLEAEADARYWQTRALELRRELLLGGLQQLREQARALMGARFADPVGARSPQDLSLEELRAHVADLAALIAALSSMARDE